MVSSSQPAVRPTESGFYNMSVANQESAHLTAEGISYADLVQSARYAFNTGKTKNLSWRVSQLRQLQKLIAENHEMIAAALQQDHAGPKVRAVFDMSAHGAAEHAIGNLEKWAAPEQVKHDNPFVGKSYIRKEPKGVVLLISPWNYPFAMVFDCLIPILAAGNCVVIKPSEVSEASCKVIADLIPKYLDNECVKVVVGGVAETTALLREKFDHIMYTGNGAVGRVVMAAAAKHLTPVTLELGGKSPVYVDKSAKLGIAAARIGVSKWVNVGQTCIAPDYILVHEAVFDEFKDLLVKQLHHYGKDASERKQNKDLGRVINSRHVSRIQNLVKNTTGKVIFGGHSHEDDRFHDPTVILEPGLDDKVMQEEIFGPVLPLLKVKNVEEAAEKVNKVCDKPLALYVFAEDQKTIDKFLNGTNSGGVCVNSTLEHISSQYLPFGGVGESGMGHYHGKFGFDEFTHMRSVYVKDTMLIRNALLPPPPYKDSLYDLVVKLTVTGFLNEQQRKVAKAAGLGLAAVVGYSLVKSKL